MNVIRICTVVMLAVSGVLNIIVGARNIKQNKKLLKDLDTFELTMSKEADDGQE